MAKMNMQQLMQQAQRMQEQLAEAEESLKDVQVSASAGGGAVKVTMNGSMQLEGIEIAPEALDPDDVEFLQDLIVIAVNDAVSQVNEVANQQMSAITGGMNIPGML